MRREIKFTKCVMHTKLEYKILTVMCPKFHFHIWQDDLYEGLSLSTSHISLSVDCVASTTQSNYVTKQE